MTAFAIVLSEIAMIIAVKTLATTTDVPPWAQWGILGALVLAFVVQQVVPGALWKAERDRANSYEIFFRDKMYPAVTESTAVLKDVVELLHLFKHDRDLQIEGKDSEIKVLLEKLLETQKSLAKLSSSTIKAADKRNKARGK